VNYSFNTVKVLRNPPPPQLHLPRLLYIYSCSILYTHRSVPVYLTEIASPYLLGSSNSMRSRPNAILLTRQNYSGNGHYIIIIIFIKLPNFAFKTPCAFPSLSKNLVEEEVKMSELRNGEMREGLDKGSQDSLLAMQFNHCIPRQVLTVVLWKLLKLLSKVK